MSQRAGLTATPARRSARLSQAGSVTNQSVITTVTTNGTRQRKKGPLTKVKARKSNAYGASGRVGAAEELSLTNTGFAQAFQNQRGDAVDRDNDDDDDDDDIDELGAETPRMSGALNGRDIQRSPSPELEPNTPTMPGLSFEDSEDPAPSDSGLAASMDQTSKSFGLVHEAGMLLRQLRQDSSRAPSEEAHAEPLWKRNRARRMQARAIVQEQEEQVEIEVQAMPVPRLKQASAAEKAAIDQSIDELVAEEQARLHRDGPPQPRVQAQKPARKEQLNSPEAINAWLGAVPDEHDRAAWNIPRLIKFLLVAFLAFGLLSFSTNYMSTNDFPETSTKTGMVGAMGARIATSWYDIADWIKPSERRKEEDDLCDFIRGDGTQDDHILWSRMGKLYREFDDRFGEMKDTIAGLHKHLPEFVIVRRQPNGKREVTDEFWHALINKANTSGNDAQWEEFISSNRNKLRDLFGVPMSNKPTESRPEAISQAEFIRMIEEHYKTKSTEIDQKIFEAVKGQATEIKSIAQSEARKAMVDSIRLQSLAQSNLLANYELNLQKPNYFSTGLGALVIPSLTSATFLDNPRLFASFARRLALVPQRNPPKAALDKWEEPGDCWCAAPSPAMNGQAQLAVSLPRPMYPKQVTIEHLPMSMMPAKKITNAPRLVELWVETTQPAEYQYAHRKGTCQDGPAGWSCLGSFTYNIHASNHQQTFDLDARSPVPVTKALVRVTSNWGADHTCLYRVRLHGDDAIEDHTYNVRLNDPAA
ncbi:UNC-like C-terminal-domain-containing protein [Paraphoma chrysanthemicola]|uniref:UNC-like C-terminal-domain-containing protein n=1 Tax=Paraphoma chrysanthemicola TaxID=798071 RepID=A0A8K0R8A0_9PLEO|nr:UNC-like C-terminal-domain-containing protein [Paraphoma chrysanthemicola]